MRGSVKITRLALFILAPAILVGVFGCQRIKKVFVEPASDEIVHESFSMNMRGYEQSAMVKAVPDEVVEYLSDLENYPRFGYGMGGFSTHRATNEDLQTGDSFSVGFAQMGLEIPGKMIVIRKDQENMWWVFENPYLYSIIRWELKPVKSGTKLRFKMEYEIPGEGLMGQLAKTREFDRMMEILLKDIDITIANMQAHFDASLNSDQLLSMGSRGNDFDSIYQIHKSSTWIDEPSQKVQQWFFDNPDYIQSIIPEMDIPFDCIDLESIPSMSPKDTRYCEVPYKMGAINFPVHTFATNLNTNRLPMNRFYMLGVGNLLMINILFEPEALGTRFTMQIVAEIPKGMNSGLMEITMTLVNISDRLERAMLGLKNNMET